MVPADYNIVVAFSNSNPAQSTTQTFEIDDGFPHTITLNSPQSTYSTNSFSINGNISSTSTTQIITAVEYKYPDNINWYACSAVDGSFDSTNENFTCPFISLSNGAYEPAFRARSNFGVQSLSYQILEYQFAVNVPSPTPTTSPTFTPVSRTAVNTTLTPTPSVTVSPTETVISTPTSTPTVIRTSSPTQTQTPTPTSTPTPSSNQLFQVLFGNGFISCLIWIVVLVLVVLLVVLIRRMIKSRKDAY